MIALLLALACAGPVCRPEDQTLPEDWEISDELRGSQGWWNAARTFDLLQGLPVCATGVELLKTDPDPDPGGHLVAWDGPGTPLQIGPGDNFGLLRGLCHARMAAMGFNPLSDHKDDLADLTLWSCPGCGLDEVLFYDEAWATGCRAAVFVGPQLAALEQALCPGTRSDLNSYYTDAFPWRPGIDAPLPVQVPLSGELRAVPLKAAANTYGGPTGTQVLDGDLVIRAQRNHVGGLLRVDPVEGEVGWFPMTFARNTWVRLYGGDEGPVATDLDFTAAWQLRSSGLVEVPFPSLSDDEWPVQAWLAGDRWWMLVRRLEEGQPLWLGTWDPASGWEDLGLWPEGAYRGALGDAVMWRAAGRHLLAVPLVLDEIDAQVLLVDLDERRVLQRVAVTDLGGFEWFVPTPDGSLLVQDGTFIAELRADGLAQVRQTACDSQLLDIDLYTVTPLDGVGAVEVWGAGDHVSLAIFSD